MAINQIAFDTSDTARVFAATSKGVYASRDSGATWKNIFRSSNMYEANCRAIFAHLSSLYAGTDQGLMVSTDAGVHWNRESGLLGKSRVLGIAVDTANEGNIYVTACDGVYRRKITAGPWEKVYDARATENSPDQDESIVSVEDAADSLNSCAMRYVCADPCQAGTVYLATAAGVLVSHDSAATWDKLTESGFSAHDIRAVAVGQGSVLYAATRSDVFLYSGESWQRAGSGITARLIQGLIAGAEHMYAACDTGLYFIGNKKPGIDPSQEKEYSYAKGLPSIASVQRAAIAYADVDMGKIDQWRKQARNKALLPSVGVGINKDTSDLWHWEGGSTTKDYDDILRKGKNVYEWDVNLSWDLGELIWNEQTSIDTRARLLVQLRDDILDEVTKLYFEYVRVRAGMDSLSLLDKNKLVEKEIRLKELAAQLDGLTDNFFSSH
jgi:hypothetical protein